jgi:hypothetical protein
MNYIGINEQKLFKLKIRREIKIISVSDIDSKFPKRIWWCLGHACMCLWEYQNR